MRQLEDGKTNPSLSLLLKVAGALNVRCGMLTAWHRMDAGHRRNSRCDEGTAHHRSSRRTASQAPVEVQVQTARKRLGQDARELRRRLGLSQQAVALRTGMDRGHRDFSVSTLLRLAASLELDVSELFSGAVDWYFRPLPAPSKAERDDALKR